MHLEEMGILASIYFLTYFVYFDDRVINAANAYKKIIKNKINK